MFHRQTSSGVSAKSGSSSISFLLINENRASGRSVRYSVCRSAWELQGVLQERSFLASSVTLSTRLGPEVIGNALLKHERVLKVKNASH
jgi:hypothetical protein